MHDPISHRRKGQGYLGIWVTMDGYARQALLANGQYEETRRSTHNGGQGQYEVMGDHIRYRDDSGSTTDGRFVDGVLYYDGLMFYFAGRTPFR